ncbi:replication initiation protein RepC (plasmid) [Bartonella apihabitans]|nr:replication initiation protein RepC [Bartonella apihabitans]WLT07746.1 replication initiation protein RepC [Bartonella apihabitans]
MMIKAKGYRARKMNEQRLRYLQMADGCEVGNVSRGQLIALVHQLPAAGIINSTEQSLLIALINTCDASCFDFGGRPIVFKTNAQLAFEIGRSDGRVSRLLSRLYDLGLVVFRDSANFRRFNGREAAGGCGIDLRILIARFCELKNIVITAREHFQKARAMTRELAGLRNQLRFAIDEPDVKISAHFSARLRQLIVADVRTANLSRLSRLLRLFRFALYCVFHVKRRDNMTNVYVENDIHKHNTNPENIRIVNAAEKQKTTTHRQLSQNALENEAEKIQFYKPLADNQLDRLSGYTLSRAFPQTQFLLNQPITTVDTLVDKRSLVAKLIGCSIDALENAEKTMGLRQTAVALAVTYEKYSLGKVTSGGGYFRALTRRFVEGRLNLLGSVSALRAANG